MNAGGLFRHSRSRIGATTVAGLLVVGSIAVFGASNGFPVQDVKLLSGMAWLSSAKVGQLTLLDGSSTEVAAQIQVAPPGNDVQVVQSGSTAYAVDRSAGTIRRVDGATFVLTQPQAPLPESRAGLSVFAGPDVLYTYDSQRGVLVDTDPRTGTARGDLQTVAAQLGDGTAGLDDDGRLWLVDNTTGDLTWTAQGKRDRTPKLASPGRNIVTVANGAPVVVNEADHKVIVIDPATGKAQDTLDLDLRPTDSIKVSGSPHDKRVYVVASRGVVNICDLPAKSCEQTVALNADSKLGAAVEAGKRLFVPDYTTGQVWIIDLASGAVTAKPQVLTTGGQFDLLSRDGVVFFNDPRSNRAGVIHLDGVVAEAKKYDESNPGNGLTVPVDQPRPPQPPQSPQQPGQQNDPKVPPRPTDTHPTNPPGPDNNTPKNNTPNPSPNNNPVPPTPPSNNDPNNPPPPPPPPPPGDPHSPPPPPPPPPPPATPGLTISAAPTSAAAGQPVTLSVAASDGQKLTDIVWGFGDGTPAGQDSPAQHTWTKESNATGYLVTVQAKLQKDGRPVAGSTHMLVNPKPVKLTFQPAPQNGKVTGGVLTCPGVCSTDIDRTKGLTVTATANQGYEFDGWAGAAECGPATSCKLNMQVHTTDFEMQAKFKAIRQPATLTIKARMDDGRPYGASAVKVSGGATPKGACASDVCTYSVPDPTVDVVLLADQNEDYYLNKWIGCDGRGTISCRFKVPQDMTVTAEYHYKDEGGFVWILPLIGLWLPARQRRDRRRRSTHLC